MVVTRGAMSTQRVESDQGDSRVHMVNARNSWMLTVKKHDIAHREKRLKLLAWVDKQVGRVLCRGPTNAQVSTVTPELLAALDAILLPWAVDEVEVQLLLAQQDNMRCIYVSDNEFKVFYDGENANDDDNVPDPAVTNMLEESSDDDSSDSSEEDPRASSKSKPNEFEGEEEPRVDRVTYDFCARDMNAEFENVMANPLPVGTTFCWKKIRTITVIPDSTDACYVKLVCRCGYPVRIGHSCRHVFGFLFSVLTTIQKARNPKADFAWSAFGEVQWEDLVNMDICSKIKYHAVMHDESGAASAGFFKLSKAMSWHPRIPASIMRTFRTLADPVGLDAVPPAGLPSQISPRRQQARRLESRDEQSSDTGERGGEAASRRSSRDPVPTEHKVFGDLERIWERTVRLKEGSKQAEARRLIATTLGTLEDQIHAMQPDAAPLQLTRRFTLSDRFHGRTK